ncbi:hypothetical protein HYT53_00570 [Candidatus Woesearchaeota archaeon]|nr:hypothetical protein [Candidatus Woesearchaeota archaeon]
MPKFKIDEITLVLIVALVAMVVGIYDRASKPGMGAEKITEVILNGQEIGLASNGVVNAEKLLQIRDMDYGKFKEYLKIKNDFCIYIEDGNGRILLAKGSPKLEKDGLPCSE